MDEQMVDKRYAESEQYTKAVKAAERIGKGFTRIREILQHAKLRLVPSPTRHA
jgi:hypothetical protein